MNNLRVIGIGEWQVSREPGDLLRTYALGSCVALVVQHPATATAGLVHILMPDSVNQPGNRNKMPGNYADTAVPLLIRKVSDMAGLRAPAGSALVAKLAGGATIWLKDSPFHVGKRNIEAVERLLRQHQVPLAARDTGGTVSRTVTVDVASGVVTVRWTPGRKEVYL